MRGERLALAGQQIVGKHFQFAAGGNFRVELPDGSGGGVARIGEAWLILLFAFGIDSLKHFSRNEDFATHFEI